MTKMYLKKKNQLMLVFFLTCRLACFMKHSPCTALEGRQELERTFVRFEEDVYSAASSKIDYQRKISAKCLSLESESQSALANSLQIGAANASGNASDLASASHIVLDDWRARVLPGSRERVVNKILETFKMHVPFSGQEELQKLEGSAARFEEWTFSDATSEFDYLERISSKLVALPGAVSEWLAADSLADKLSDLGINN